MPVTKSEIGQGSFEGRGLRDTSSGVGAVLITPGRDLHALDGEHGVELELN